LKCGYSDQFRSSRFDFEREVLEKKHFDSIDPHLSHILNSLQGVVKSIAEAKRLAGKRVKWGYPTIEAYGFAWTMTSTGSALWRMDLATFKTRGWSPKNYFDSTNKTWTVARKPKAI